MSSVAVSGGASRRSDWEAFSAAAREDRLTEEEAGSTVATKLPLKVQMSVLTGLAGRDAEVTTGALARPTSRARAATL